MTADEIRAVMKFEGSPMPSFVSTSAEVSVLAMQVRFLQEIAAQLAELNERLKPGNFEANIYDCSFEGSRKAGEKP